jgi:hypothetical protein
VKIVHGAEVRAVTETPSLRKSLPGGTLRG